MSARKPSRPGSRRASTSGSTRVPGKPVPIGGAAESDPPAPTPRSKSSTSKASTRKPAGKSTASRTATSARGPKKGSASTKSSTGSAPSAGADGSESFRAERLATSRFGIVYDIDGPKVRLGLAWFVAAIVASYLGMFALAVLVGGIAALAGAQTAQALRTKWRRPDRATAAIIAGLVPLAAALGTGMAGLVLIAAAIAAVVTAASRTPRRTHPIIDAGAVLRSSVFVGLAAASMVMVARVDIGAVVMLILMLSAYETGDYLIGSGASNVIEGPFSGVLVIIVITGVASSEVLLPPPFTVGGLWLYALFAAISAPVGQVLASAILPRAGAPAPALRRLDSYLVTGPVWLALLWGGVGI